MPQRCIRVTNPVVDDEEENENDVGIKLEYHLVARGTLRVLACAAVILYRDRRYVSDKR